MSGSNQFSAKFEDLLLTITQRGDFWQACVEEVGDPDSALSGGIDYPSIERAKQGAVEVAQELFGTGVTADELDWLPASSS